MEIRDLIDRFSDTKENQAKAVFSTIFIVGNRLQTLFDSRIPEISLKQFMLLTMVRQTGDEITLTQIGKLLGCSRQNVRKLANVLEKKGYIEIGQSSTDLRALCIRPTEKMNQFFGKVFSVYQEELAHFFEVYTDDEIEMLFHLMMKMYTGTERLENSLQSREDRGNEQSPGYL